MSATEAAVETWVLVASVAIEVIVGPVWLPGVAAIEVIEVIEAIQVIKGIEVLEGIEGIEATVVIVVTEATGLYVGIPRHLRFRRLALGGGAVTGRTATVVVLW